MNALISGQAGLALVVDGDRLATIHAHEPDVLVDRHAGELPFLIGEGRDFVPVENASRAEIPRRLQQAQDREDTLELALMLMDPELSDDLRMETAGELEELLSSPDLTRYLESVLYARPLPDSADLEGGLSMAREHGSNEVAGCLERLRGNQLGIRAVRAAWDGIPWARLGTEEATWQLAAVREGLFVDLLNGLNDLSLDEFFNSAVTRPAIQALSDYARVLQYWIRPFEEALSLWEESSFRQASVVREPPGVYDPNKSDKLKQ